MKIRTWTENSTSTIASAFDGPVFQKKKRKNTMPFPLLPRPNKLSLPMRCIEFGVLFSHFQMQNTKESNEWKEWKANEKKKDVGSIAARRNPIGSDLPVKWTLKPCLRPKHLGLQDGMKEEGTGITPDVPDEGWRKGYAPCHATVRSRNGRLGQ